MHVLSSSTLPIVVKHHSAEILGEIVIESDTVMMNTVGLFSDADRSDKKKGNVIWMCLWLDAASCTALHRCTVIRCAELC
jgi:hypothetical protein